MAAHKVEYLEKQINQNKSISLINPKAYGILSNRANMYIVFNSHPIGSKGKWIKIGKS